MQTEELKKYELMVILSGQMAEGDFAKELDEIRKLLQENTSGIAQELSWGRRELSYRLKRQNHGYYLVFTFTAGPSALAELTTTIKLNPNVLRHLLITVPNDHQLINYETLPEEKPIDRKEMRREKKITPQSSMPVVAEKSEDKKLEHVEKKLEEILENPDIDIR